MNDSDELVFISHNITLNKQNKSKANLEAVAVGYETYNPSKNHAVISYNQSFNNRLDYWKEILQYPGVIKIMMLVKCQIINGNIKTSKLINIAIECEDQDTAILVKLSF